MFVSFLLPFAERGAGPIHHWVMLAQMASFSQNDIVFVADEAYFDEETIPFGQLLKLGGLKFTCPTRDQFRGFRKIALDQRLMGELFTIGTHLDVLRRLLVDEVPCLVSALKDVLSEFVLSGHLEAVLTWCNCPSLRRAFDELGGGFIVHNELGALRSPLYQDTFYFDLQGVNGATTAASWDPMDISAQLEGTELRRDDELRGLLVADVQRVDALEPGARLYDVGVALQVEDDSNLIAFARGWDSLSLLYDAIGRFGPESTLVRSHPGARFIYQGGLGVADSSADSLAFLNSIGALLSINSSLLAEAALWGKPLEAKGDTPAVCLSSLDKVAEKVANAVRNAFFLGYLVPSEYLFDAEYYRWRLAGASLGECIARHAAVYAGHGRPTSIAALPSDPNPALRETRLIRLPPLWTATLAVEDRLEKLRAEVTRLEAQRAAEAKHSQIEIDSLKASAHQWQSEAEANWRALEWFKGHVVELQESLAKCSEHVRRVEHELSEARLRSDTLEACIKRFREERELRQQRHAEESAAHLKRIEDLELELNQFVILSSRILPAGLPGTVATDELVGLELQLLRDRVARHIASIEELASKREALIERLVAATGVLCALQRDNCSVDGDREEVDEQPDRLVLVSERVAFALQALHQLREAHDRALDDLTAGHERLGQILERIGIRACDYTALSSRVEKLSEWISITQEQQTRISAEVQALRRKRSLLELIVGREVTVGSKQKG